MNRKFRIAAITAVLATAGIATGAAIAAGDGCRGPWGRDVRAMAEDRLGKLHDVLKLNAEQEPAWVEFRTAISAQAGKAAERMRDWRDGPRPASAIERLDRGQQALDEGRSALADVATATRRFYATLSKEQQARFDEATRRLGQGRFGHRGPMPGSV